MNCPSFVSRPLRFLAHGILVTSIAVSANEATAQSVTLDFRFDGQTGNAATTKVILPGAAGQTFTIDLWATIAGDATHTNTANFGIKNVALQGFSSIVSGGGAFSGGATIGYVTGSVIGHDNFAGHVNQPGVADTGTTTNGTSVTLTPDGILDFGKNNTLSNENASLTTGYELGGSFGQAGGAPGTWQFEVLQFKFTTGTASLTSGAITKFFPTLPNNTTQVNYTIDGTNAVTPATWTVGSPVTFIVNAIGSASWNQNANGNYSDLPNWDPNQIPNGAGLVATFGNGTTNAVSLPNITVTVDAALTVGKLIFSNTNGTSYTLGNDGVAGHTITLDNGGAGAQVNSQNGNNWIFSGLVLNDNATFNVSTGSSVLVSLGNISETGGSRNVTKTGGGTLTIDMPSAYTGTTTASAGTLVTTPTGTISTGPLVVSSSGGVNSLVSLNNNQSVSSLSGTISGAGTATVSVAGGNTLTVAQSSNTTFAGNFALTGSGAMLAKTGAGTLETGGGPALATGSVINVSGGTLRFNVASGAAAISSGVTANVSSNATLELAGSVSALSSSGSPANRVDIANNSTAAAGVFVTGSSQQVGSITGSGTTSVATGGALTADNIIQGALVIGGSSTIPATATINTSNASGNPTALGSASVLAASGLGSSDANLGATGLIAGGVSLPEAGGFSAFGAAGSGSSAAVPEPGTVLLSILAAVICFTAYRKALVR